MEIPENIKLFAEMTWALRGLAFKLRGRHADGSCCDIVKPSAGMPERLWIDLASEDDIRGWSGGRSVGRVDIQELFDPRVFARRKGFSAPMGFIDLAIPIPHPWFINREPGLLVTIMESDNLTVTEPPRRRIDGWQSGAGTWVAFANSVRLQNDWSSQNLSSPSEVGVLGEDFEYLDSEHLFLKILPVLPTICRKPEADLKGNVTDMGEINHAYMNVIIANKCANRWKNDGLLDDDAAISLYKSIDKLFEVILENLNPLKTMDPGFLPEFRKFADQSHAG
jgi:hypothetical protein